MSGRSEGTKREKGDDKRRIRGEEMRLRVGVRGRVERKG